jgi:hypothetical protein
MVGCDRQVHGRNFIPRINFVSKLHQNGIIDQGKMVLIRPPQWPRVGSKRGKCNKRFNYLWLS